ncbi:leucine-rich repeat domain-containing protein [Roseibacillus ishigakijimensis]|uniref:Leucine-rich repeat domain-containing protein n=1 Tax=Roseibacillus ishigakijimensis TaxID=454146 RepID=A0A934RX34_9BACT|nr:leucine-rich repeat domain-containing protein [Roseibacillus ishigakijimensis]MBK1835740.1 leucine-rich repeat domain-containing protein [Roseibacillus ishigakijimensis]
MGLYNYPVFHECLKLEKITVAEENTHFYDNDGVLFRNFPPALLKYPPRKDNSFFSIPSGIEIIYEEAFADSEKLTSIIIPNSVSEIHSGAFKSCTSLTSFAFPLKVTIVSGLVLVDCVNIETVTLSPETTEIGDTAFGGCSALTEITLHDKN